MADGRNETIAELRQIIVKLRARVAELEMRLGQNSANSGKPPSSDAPSDRESRAKPPPSGRPRGGQPGHKGHRRALIPPEQVTSSYEHFPEACRRCGSRLPKTPCAEPLRHQVIEVPEVRPDVTEHRLHEGCCVNCGTVTRASLPTDVPAGMCGPRLVALISLLTGAYKLSRRQATTFLSDVLGIRMSLGALSESEKGISEALAEPVQAALEYACREPVKHIDATGWRESNESRSLWTIATASVTVFAITLDGSREYLQGLLTCVRGILVTDRAPQFGFWAMDHRQICWAHLLRKFTAFAEDNCPDVAHIGEQLLRLGHLLFHDWHCFRDGTMSRAELRRRSVLIRACTENYLRNGVALQRRGVSGSCEDMLAHREALWTFIDTPRVEPTNNHAERELRGFVLWRKKCFGSQSERGTRFAERVMTAVHTLRKQGRHVLSFLTAAAESRLRPQAALSLLPTTR